MKQGDGSETGGRFRRFLTKRRNRPPCFRTVPLFHVLFLFVVFLIYEKLSEGGYEFVFFDGLKKVSRRS